MQAASAEPRGTRSHTAPPSCARMKREFCFFSVIGHLCFHLDQLFSFSEVNGAVLALDLLRRIIIGTRINILL